MKRRTSMAVTVVFVTVITLPLVLFVVGVRPQIVDNRAATEWPDVGADSIADGKTYESIAAYLTDRFPLRDRAVRFEAEVAEATSVWETYRPGEPSGTDGWLFLPDTLEDSCDEPDPAGFLEDLDNTAEQVAEAGVPFVFAVVPNKAQVYPEHLLPVFQGPNTPECPRVWRQAMEEAAESRAWMFDLFGPLDDAARSSTDLVYYETDTHWTDLGALIGVEAVVTELLPGAWDPDEIESNGELVGVRDLTRLLGLDDEETVPRWVVRRPGVEVDVVEEGPDNTVIRSRATSTQATLVPGTTVFVGDSFGVHENHLLQPYFEDLVFIKSQHLDETQIAEIVATRPNAIVVQFIARNLDDGVATTPLARVRKLLASG